MSRRHRCCSRRQIRQTTATSRRGARGSSRGRRAVESRAGRFAADGLGGLPESRPEGVGSGR